MTNISRFSGLLCAMIILSAAGRCPAADAPATTGVVVEHVRMASEPPEEGLGTTVYVPSKAEAAFFNKLSEKEKTTGGHDDDYDITKKAGKYIAWFGIVREIVEDPAKKRTVLTVEHKYFDGLTDTHLLAVSFNGSGDFQAIVPGTGHQIGPLSLVRIYGTVTPSKVQQLPQVDTVFMRAWHWDTFTFISAYGKQRGNEKWRKQNHANLDNIYSSSPSEGYYRARLGERPEDITRAKAVMNRLVQAAITAGPDPDKNFQTLAEGMLDVNSFEKQHEALHAIFNARAFDGLTALLIKAINEEDARLRCRAVMIIADNVGELASGAVPALVTALSDSDHYVRTYTPSALEKVGPAAAIALPGLIALMKDSDHYVRAHALAAMGEIGVPAEKILPTFIAATSDSDDYVRFTAINELEKLGHAASTAVGPLIDRLQNDEDPKVKWNAARAIGIIDAEGKLGVPALTAGLKSRDASVRRFASLGLAAQREKALPALPDLERLLTDSDRATRIAAAEAVWKLSHNLKITLPVLIQELEMGGDYPPMWAADAIAEIGPRAQEAIPALRKQLKRGGDYSTANAARALGTFGAIAGDAAPDLVELLTHERDNVRVNAAEALWSINCDPRAISQLLKELEGTSWAQSYAIAAIGRIGKPAIAALPMLKELTYSRQYWTRREARGALKKLESLATP